MYVVSLEECTGTMMIKYLNSLSDIKYKNILQAYLLDAIAAMSIHCKLTILCVIIFHLLFAALSFHVQPRAQQL